MLSALKEWVLILFLTSFIGTIANMLSPSNPNMKKYVKFACAVVASAIMIIPIKNLFTDIPSIYANYSENFNKNEFYGNITENVSNYENEWVITKTVDALRNGIDNTIYSKYGINSKNIYINIMERDENSGTKSNIVVKSIIVELDNKDVLTYYKHEKDAGEVESVEVIRKEIEDYLRYLAEFDIDVKIVGGG